MDMTRRQRRIKERNAKIRLEYNHLQRATDKKLQEIFVELADKYDLEPHTIRHIVWDKIYCSISEYGPTSP